MNCCVEVKVEKIHTPKPIRMTKYNYFSFKKTKTPVQKMRTLEDISLEEIDNDFKLLKSKSEEILCGNEFSEILSTPITRPDSNESIKSLGRCINPFYKNFENEVENNLK